MSSQYLDKIHAITELNGFEKISMIVDIIMSTNDSITATPNFAKEVRTALIILISSQGFSAHLYHLVLDISWVRSVIYDFNDSDIVSAQDKDQVETFLNSAHIMVIEGMLCRVFGVEYSGETFG